MVHFLKPSLRVQKSILRIRNILIFRDKITVSLTSYCCLFKPQPGAPPAVVPSVSSSLYPSLDDYMGMRVSEDAVRQHVPGYVSYGL